MFGLLESIRQSGMKFNWASSNRGDEIMTLLQEAEHLQTIVELFAWRCMQHPEDEALRYKSQGKWISISYGEWLTSVRRLSRILPDYLSRGDFVCIISENRPEWTMVDFATMACGGIVSPIYATSLPRDMAYIVNDCQAKLLFVSDKELLDKVITLLDEGEIPSVTLIVTFDDTGQSHPKVISFQQLMNKGRVFATEEFLDLIKKIDPDDVLTVIYTSGTTGNPKGVMLTHRNIMSNIKAAVQTIGEHYFHQGCLLSFLPLSHSLERSCGYYLALLAGVSIAYAESIAKLLQNFAEVKPTILVSVPRIYEKIYAALLDSATTPLKKKIISWAMQIGRQKAFHDVEGRPVDALFPLKYALAYRLVFSKLHQRLGGRFRFAACGGAPLSKEIAIFLKGAGILVIEGYGQTETSPILTLNGPDQMRFGSVGRAVPGVELRLEPDPEGQQGTEILARGPNIMKGYYNKPAETRNTVSEDGWIATGDIGYLDEDGYLFITDRKKELLKTSGGKFVAPAPIENSLKDNPFIEQACVIGNSRKYCTVLIFPNKSALEKEFNRPLTSSDYDLAGDQEIKTFFQAIIEAQNKTLNTWEQIKKFAFLPHELSLEHDELTPTLKLKRRVIDERYHALIDELYRS